MRNLILILLIVFCSCEQDQGKRNATKFVEDAIGRSLALDASQVESIEIVDEDTLLSHAMLMVPLNEILKAKSQFIQGEITRDSLTSVCDKDFRYWEAVQTSWYVDSKFGKNDPQYQTWLRRVFKFKVKFKDGKLREPRLVMDADGITPVALESEVQMKLGEYNQELSSAAYM